MAITRSQYVRELEGRMGRGDSFDKAHKKSAEKATITPAKKRSVQNERLIKKVARRLYEVFYGKKAYSKKRKKPTFTQVLSVEGRLRRAGFPEDKIKKYTGKKK